jgi:hypothetical protein
MNKLLKDAIADAKAVRETALANAKMALEEAFAPKLQSMLSHKIKEEMEEEEPMAEMEDEEEITMEMSHEDEMTSEGEGGDAEMEDEVESEEDMEVSDEGSEEEASAEAEEEEMSDEELEEILRELEGEEDEMATEGEMADEEDAMNEEEDMEAEEEEVDLEEIIRALREEEGEEEKMEEEEDMEAEAELEEAYEVIKYLRSKLNEVNLLNAKLLYVNKLFKKAELSESKKVKIIETFDRVTTVREAKLVYATLAESMTTSAPIANNKKVVKRTKRGLTEGIASAPSKATKKPIIENTVYNRFNELINYNK